MGSADEENRYEKERRTWDNSDDEVVDFPPEFHLNLLDFHYTHDQTSSQLSLLDFPNSFPEDDTTALAMFENNETHL